MKRDDVDDVLDWMVQQLAITRTEASMRLAKAGEIMAGEGGAKARHWIREFARVWVESRENLAAAREP